MELRVARTVMLLVLLDVSSCLAEKLSPGQKAPAFAKGSGGLALKAPYEGVAGAADVGHKRGQSNPAPPAAPSTQVDGVAREETEELKEVDGQLVRVVKGNFAYDSPEGLPIAVKYVADENGNRASFTFGTAAGKPSGGSRASGSGSKPGLTPGGPGATSLGNAGGSHASGGNGRPGGATGGGNNRPVSGQGGASTYLPPTTKVDRSYLPPN